MSVVLVVVIVITLLVYFEILLWATRILRRSKAVQLVDALCDRIVGRVFTLLRIYCGFSFPFENRAGEKLPPRFILIANHQSLFDILLCMYMVPERRLRFVAKKELGLGIPFVSSVLRTQGHALITRRGDTARAMGTLHRFGRRCRREGTCPVVFPEGTRSRDGNLGSFYTAGLRKVLEEEALPLVVVAIDGGWKVAKVKDFLHNFRNITYRFRISTVLPPPHGKRETLDAIAKARDIIGAEIADMRKQQA